MINKELIKRLDQMKYVYDKGVDDYTHSTRRAKTEVEQAYQQIKSMFQPVPEEKREEIVKRYKILFHDVAESNIEPLIRKLMDELKESSDER